MFLIGIDGLAGSGKSTFARALAEEIGAQVVCLDDFSTWVGEEWSAADVERVRREVLDPLLAGRPARYQRYDWTRREPGEWMTVHAEGTVIVEGVRALHRRLADVYALGIWVQVPREVRLARGLRRDGGAFEAQWERWLTSEERYLAEQDPIGRADAVIDGLAPLSLARSAGPPARR